MVSGGLSKEAANTARDRLLVQVAQRDLWCQKRCETDNPRCRSCSVAVSWF